MAEDGGGVATTVGPVDVAAGAGALAAAVPVVSPVVTGVTVGAFETDATTAGLERTTFETLAVEAAGVLGVAGGVGGGGACADAMATSDAAAAADFPFFDAPEARVELWVLLVFFDWGMRYLGGSGDG
jgi:hypothetical protein